MSPNPETASPASIQPTVPSSVPPSVPRVVQEIPSLRLPLPFYMFRRWVKPGSPIRLFEHLIKTYGNISQYSFMGTPIIFLNDPRYIQQVLVTDAQHFVKERTVRRMKVLLGEGLITSEDPVHKRQRRIAAPAFHRQRIAAYGDQIVSIAQSHRDQWQPGQQIDIAAASMALSLEIVARTLFDTDVTPEIRAINDEVNTIMHLYNFIVAFPRIESVLHLPIPGIVKFRKSKARLDAVVNRLIAEHRKSRIDKGDLLSMLLSSTYEPTEAETAAGKPPERMSDAQIRDEVLTIFLAGYETVANALTWTWYLLSQNPEVEKKLHAELDTVLGIGTGNQQRLPTLADYPRLRYTEQVFAESMRLYPPAWAMGRMSTRELHLGPYNIPAGAHVFFSQYIMSRTPEYFPDPLRFDPGRFTPEAKAARPKFTYFPFGGGSRQCIGESFAWMEGVFSIATIAQRWRMSYLGATQPVPQAKITLRPRDPLMMQLIPR
ncbi:MAG TPA: cytochrome P450 [Edaphobacter sp.]|jgi:cytochrome P450|nr:cytochrome P450 [Edaphobacter sp.]